LCGARLAAGALSWLGKGETANYFIGAACNVKRWIRLEAWKLRQALSVGAAGICQRGSALKQKGAGHP